jgi:hypothetical protein
VLLVLLSMIVERVAPHCRRDEARRVFVAMVAELGAGYLPYAATVLQGALPDKGYTAQVRGYTLHALLEALAQVSPHRRSHSVVRVTMPAVASCCFPMCAILVWG